MTIKVEIEVELSIMERMAIADLYDQDGAAHSTLCRMFLEERIRGLLGEITANFLMEHPVWKSNVLP